MTRNIYLFLMFLSASMLTVGCSDDLGQQGAPRIGEESLAFNVKTASWGDTLTVGPAGTRVAHGEMETAKGKMAVTAVFGEEIGLWRSMGQQESAEETDDGEQASTRAVQKSQLEASDKFMVTCYAKTTDDAGAVHEQIYFANEEVSWNAGKSKFMTDKNYLWRSAPKVSFYAYWPVSTGTTFDAGNKVLNYQLNKPAADEASLDYTGVYTAEQQPDLLYAVNTDTGSSEDADVPLEFKHGLTAVQFCSSPAIGALNAGDVVIKRVAIKNVAWKGKLDLKKIETSPNEAWTAVQENAGDLADFYVTPSTPTPGESTIPFNQNEHTFYMIPQSLESPLKGVHKAVEIVFEQGGQTNYFQANLDDLPAWEPGQTVRYVLGTKAGKAYVITAAAASVKFSSTKATVKVNSYEMDLSTGTQTRVGWKLTGVSIDNGKTWNKPDAATWKGQDVDDIEPWMSGLTDFYDYTTGGAATQVSKSGTITKPKPDQIDSRADEIDRLLQSVAFNTTYRDLSYYNANGQALGNRFTANCYVVSEPGRYELPAIYGNGVVNGVEQLDNCVADNYENYSEFATKPTSVYIWEDKIRSSVDVPKTAPDKVIQPAKAELLWQQVHYYDYNLGQMVYDATVIDANSVSYNASTHMIRFQTVPSNQMHQGNAVIALKDADGTIIWSWHIWVTTAMRYAAGSTPDNKIPEYDTDVTNKNGITYHYAPVNVGAIYQGSLRIYKKRGLTLRLQQTDAAGNLIKNGSTCKCTITQEGGSDPDDRVLLSTSYQFGRKDPLPKSKTYSAQSLPAAVVPASGFSNKGSDLSKKPIGASIREPNVFFNTGATPTWMSTNHPNLWSKAQTTYTTVPDIPVIKTIYDPCPYPYHVPAVGFADVASFVLPEVSPQTIVTPIGTGYAGFTFAIPVDSHGHTTVFFSFSSYYNNSSTIQAGSAGRYLHAYPRNSNFVYVFMFLGTDVSLHSGDITSGYAVRPVREE